MFRLVLVIFILFCTSCFASIPSEKEVADAEIYMGSKMYPVILELCSSTYPADAERYKKAFDSWLSFNSRAIISGEKVVIDQAKRDGTNMEALFTKYFQNMKDEFASLKDQKKSERCSRTLNVMLSEQ